MARAILIDVSKLVSNFDEVYKQAQEETDTIIRVHSKGKVLTLSKNKPNVKRNVKKPK